MNEERKDSMTGRIALIACVTLGVTLGALSCLPSPASADAGCENEARRSEQRSTLPDCRAYELVTPHEKNSGEPMVKFSGSTPSSPFPIEGTRAAIDGDRMAYTSESALPGSQSPGLDYLSTRGEGAWSTENVIPPQSPENGLLCPWLVGMAAYSSDLSKAVLADGFGQSQGFEQENYNCGHDEPLLVPGEPEGFQNLFVRDNRTASYQLVNVTPSDVTAPKPTPGVPSQYFPAAFLGGSADLGHVVFEEELALTPEAPVGDDLYEWSAGGVHLVTILPDGTPAAGSLASATRNTTLIVATFEFVPRNIADFRHAVSADGSRVFFEAGGGLYVRENGDQQQSPLGVGGSCTDATRACTLQVDASQAGGGGGGGKFMAASADGSKVFFTDDAAAALTGDTLLGSGQNLYEYDLPAENDKPGRLIDLTAAADAGVQGVAGASEDGSYVYFVAEGALASGASAGQPNLYVIHAGVTTFVATLDSSSDSCDWISAECVNYPLGGGLTARTSPGGRYIAFESVNKLTGYDNTDVNTGQPDGEIFLYDAEPKRLSCASCDPGGARPVAQAIIRYPVPPSTDSEMRNTYPQRNVSEDGQVFFETAGPLLPQDTDGVRDVYEYEGGRLYLISSGTSEADSYFLDASASGGDVFFMTAQKLLASDVDSVYDVYDARVDGGFPQPAISPSCGGEGCREPVAGAPALSTPASVDFSGPGNIVPSPPRRSRLTRAQKLAKALRACHRKKKRKRRVECERKAHKQYAAKRLRKASAIRRGGK